MNKKKQNEIIEKYNKEILVYIDKNDYDFENKYRFITGNIVNTLCKFKLKNVGLLNLTDILIKNGKHGGQYNPQNFASLFFYVSKNTMKLKNLITKNFDVYSLDHLDKQILKNIHETVILLLFRNGTVVIGGASSENKSRLYSRIFCNMLKKTYGINTSVQSFKLQNLVITYKLPFKINLYTLCNFTELKNQSKYTDNFPSATIYSKENMFKDNLTAVISDNGYINITGGKTIKDSIIFLKFLYPFLYKNTQKSYNKEYNINNYTINNIHKKTRSITDNLFSNVIYSDENEKKLLLNNKNNSEANNDNDDNGVNNNNNNNSIINKNNKKTSNENDIFEQLIEVAELLSN